MKVTVDVDMPEGYSCQCWLELDNKFTCEILYKACHAGVNHYCKLFGQLIDKKTFKKCDDCLKLVKPGRAR